jgi:hypothetical protein
MIMKFGDIKFDKLRDFPYGLNAILPFGEYELSIIQNDMSYGSKEGLYEIGVFKNDDMVELPGITYENDSVRGHLDEAGVEEIIEKMNKLI